MFCPQCSQAQVNTELKFCSRCGFALQGVKELMATGGELPVKNASSQQRAIASRRILQGITLMMSAMIGGGILTVVAREYGFSRLPGTLIILIGFFIGAMRMFTATTHTSNPDLGAMSKRSATTGPIAADQARQPPELSEARTRPIDQEFVPPRESPVPVASVTEHTTELLDQF